MSISVFDPKAESLLPCEGPQAERQFKGRDTSANEAILNHKMAIRLNPDIERSKEDLKAAQGESLISFAPKKQDRKGANFP